MAPGSRTRVQMVIVLYLPLHSLRNDRRHGDSAGGKWELEGEVMKWFKNLLIGESNEQEECNAFLLTES